MTLNKGAELWFVSQGTCHLGARWLLRAASPYVKLDSLGPPHLPPLSFLVEILSVETLKCAIPDLKRVACTVHKLQKEAGMCWVQIKAQTGSSATTSGSWTRQLAEPPGQKTEETRGKPILSLRAMRTGRVLKAVVERLEQQS